MKLQRLVALALVGGLVVGGVTAADAKKKKKKKKIVKLVPVDRTYHMRRDACGTDADNLRLSIEDGTNEGTGCGSRLNGAPNEFFYQTGAQAPIEYTWPATDGVPFILDATKKISGEVSIVPGASVSGFGSGVGEAELIVTLTGTVGGKAVTIGETVQTYMVTPAQAAYTVEYEIEPDAALAKKAFSSFEMKTVIRGTSLTHGYYELDEAPAELIVPQLKKKIIRK